ncbi:MAG: ABC transporter ATP-binding protein, partial [Rhodospirillales bacterium]
MTDGFLALSGLTLAYGGTVAVDRLDLAMAEGELVALLGPSGCGKTTTMRAVAGLLQPRAGTIRLAGRDITHVPANKRGVGLVFQSYALFPHLSVFENVAFGLRLAGTGRDEIGRRVAEVLAMVGLTGFERR